MRKTLIFSAFIMLLATASFASAPNAKVLKAFEATFTSPEGVTWYDHADYYDVSFTQSGIRTNVRYDNEGNFMNATRYYSEQQLPTNILCKLKKKYADKKIFGVTEITSGEDLSYYVKIEDDKNWITLKINAGGVIEVYEKFRKAQG